MLGGAWQAAGYVVGAASAYYYWRDWAERKTRAGWSLWEGGACQLARGWSAWRSLSRLEGGKGVSETGWLRAESLIGGD